MGGRNISEQGEYVPWYMPTGVVRYRAIWQRRGGEKMKKALILGEVCQDIIVHDPRSVKVLEQPVWAGDVLTVAGGSAVFVASALNHLGIPVELWSTLGEDEVGLQLIDEMTGRGIDCRFVKRLPGYATTRSVIVCEQESKDFIGCTAMLPLQIPDQICAESVSLLYIAGYMLFPELWETKTISLIEKTHHLGIPVVVDSQQLPIPGDMVTKTRLREIMPHVSVFLVARREAKQLTGSQEPLVAGREFLSMGVETAVMKQGEEGCTVLTTVQPEQNDYGQPVGEVNGRPYYAITVPAYPVKVYDSVGSGDLFGAGYSFGILQGWGPRECTRFAAVFTALSLGKYDTHKILPSFEKVSQILEAEGL
jgi:sugar/nucleoside kinase (ribokinase family)